MKKRHLQGFPFILPFSLPPFPLPLFPFFVLFFISPFTHSAPWIGTDDRWLRSDIEYLADAKVISVPITTWPLMWSGVNRDLESVSVDALSHNELQAYRRVRRAFRRESKIGDGLYFALRAANAEKEFMHFGDLQREHLEGTVGSDWLGERFAFRLRATYVDDPKDNKEKRLDGSFLSGILGNWSLTAGAIDYWWGPAWDSSLILSNNARPVPAITLQRNDSQAFEWPVLRWIGPWHFVTFMGKLEHDRTIPESLLFGIRASFKPFSSLELGGARIIHWGGEGHDNSPRQFWGAFTSTASEARTKENVNSLAGIDFRYGTEVLDHAFSVYSHYMIEDGANPKRGKYFWMAGASFKGFEVFSSSLEFFIKYADTMAHKAFTQIRRQNIAYEHGRYPHRYRNRSLGSTYDNDSSILTFGSLFHLANGHLASVYLHRLVLNRDGQPAGNTIAMKKQDLYQGALAYQIPTQLGNFLLDLNYKTEALTGDLSNKKNGWIGLSWQNEW